MARRTKQEAFQAGRENPLIGDIAPLQRLANVLGGLGAELSGADMGTPVGQRYGERMRQGEAEIRRLQELRAAYPEEFGRGMMREADVQDPYMFGLGLGSAGAMRPMGSTRFSPAGGAGGEVPVRAIEGPGGMRALPAPPVRELPAPVAAPAAPYYRTVPAEMGTSMRPMTPFQQNQVGLSTGRYGMQGYAPEMAVTDFETYAPGGAGRTSPETWGRPLSKFDQNMYDAYVRGRMNRMAGGRPSMAGEYTPEEMGSAIVPYRQGGLVYEPVGGQGASQGGLPMMAQGRGLRPTLLEGEFSEVSPQGQIPYGMGYRPNFTTQGAPYTPSAGAAGPSMGQRMAQGAYNYQPTPTRPGMPWGTVAGIGAAGAAVPLMAEYGSLMDRPISSLSNNPMQPSSAPPAGALQGRSGDIVGNPAQAPYGTMSPYGFAGNFDLGNAPAGGARMEAMKSFPAAPPKQGRKSAGGGAKGVPMPPQRPADLPQTPGEDWHGNFNYYVTQAIDRLLGGGEAERGLGYQQYYGTNPWPY